MSYVRASYARTGPEKVWVGSWIVLRADCLLYYLLASATNTRSWKVLQPSGRERLLMLLP